MYVAHYASLKFSFHSILNIAGFNEKICDVLKFQNFLEADFPLLKVTVSPDHNHSSLRLIKSLEKLLHDSQIKLCKMK